MSVDDIAVRVGVYWPSRVLRRECDYVCPSCGAGHATRAAAAACHAAYRKIEQGLAKARENKS